MQMVEHSVDVRGPKVSNGQRSPSAIGSVLRWVDPLARETVSMAFRFSSRALGRPPSWFVRASTMRFADMSRGDGFTRLHFEVPPFGEAAAELYEQKELPAYATRPDPSDTALDLLGDLLYDVVHEERDSYRFDGNVLKRLGGFSATASRWGVESLALHGHRLSQQTPPLVDAQISRCAETLRVMMPSPVRARVAGKLDMIRASDGSFGLLLESGEAVHGVLLADGTSALRELWNRPVVVEGRAAFRPSGSLLCLEAEGMALATQADLFFSKVPTPRAAKLERGEFMKPQTRTTGLGAIFGKWPGDETEEQLLAAIQEMD